MGHKIVELLNVDDRRCGCSHEESSGLCTS